MKDQLKQFCLLTCVRMRANVSPFPADQRCATSVPVDTSVNTHNARIWSLENPHEVLEPQRDKLVVFVPHLIFGEPTVTGFVYLDALQLWLFPQLKESGPDDFI
ncbi:hypothetical protein TNCV_3927121 [Trichonephila clavipes]|nr:hypothetical protein TNCV_3927121 [Trichonephila clavipes]